MFFRLPEYQPDGQQREANIELFFDPKEPVIKEGLACRFRS